MPFVLSLMTVWLLQLTTVQGAASRNQVCGLSLISPRIVGGQPSSEGAWPWQVSILKEDYVHCGGSLITDQWVLSAAHCFFENKSIELYDVVVGVHQLLNPTKDAQIIRVIEIISNPDFNLEWEDLRGDIALVKLASPVNFTNYILPICLPGSSVQIPPNASCWITGWGAVKENENLPEPMTLQELKVPPISQETCNELYNKGENNSLGKDPILPDMICAGYPEGGKDACQGDSGGPLVCKLKRGWTQFGVQSWGQGCAKPSYPGVYASVTYYAKWIDETIVANGGGQNGGLHNTLTVTLLLLTSALAHQCNNTSDYKVLLGAYQLSNRSHSVIRSDVEQIEIHPDYYPYIADIALVKLKAPVEYTDYIQPISLPHALEEVPMDADCWVTGWGDIKYNVSLPVPQTLQELKVPLINRSACNDLYNSAPTDDIPMDPVKPGMLCAGYPEGEKDTCQGDSGGPLVCKHEGGWTQVGVVSGGGGCAEPKHPSVYTSVSAFVEWIQATTGALQTAPLCQKPPRRLLMGVGRMVDGTTPPLSPSSCSPLHYPSCDIPLDASCAMSSCDSLLSAC
ncbi:tryptase gamma-like [Elgaria multicarinata webbii]|uniref:tryptase gamma-like n=1 Tax=Elgaria multicarinata webbii TaxID=159646 RepID=UPI002FCD6674